MYLESGDSCLSLGVDGSDWRLVVSLLYRYIHLWTKLMKCNQDVFDTKLQFSPILRNLITCLECDILYPSLTGCKHVIAQVSTMK